MHGKRSSLADRSVVLTLLQVPMEQIVITNDVDAPFQDLSKDIRIPEEKESLRGVFAATENAKDYFTNKIQRLWQHTCPLCDLAEIKTLAELKQHTKKHHVSFW